MKLAWLILAACLPAAAHAAEARVEAAPVAAVTPVPSLAPALTPALGNVAAPTSLSLPSGPAAANLAAPAVAPSGAASLGASAAIPALAPSAIGAAEAGVPTPASSAAAAPLPARAGPERSGALGALGSLQKTDAAVERARAQPTGGGAQVTESLSSLFGEGARAGSRAAAAVDAAPSPSAGLPRSGLSAAAPRSRARRALPPGVKDAFRKAALMTTVNGGTLLGLWPTIHHAAPQASPLAYSLLMLPLSLLVVHFALVGGFWAGRYYAYPKLGETGQRVFRGAWKAVSLVYPAAAAVGLAWWTKTVAPTPALLAMLALPATFAAGEVIHHFIWRLVPERAQDKGKPLTDAESRLGGNIGQNLKRLRVKPAR